LVVLSWLVEGEIETIATALDKLPGDLLLDTLLFTFESASNSVLGLVPLGLVE